MFGKDRRKQKVLQEGNQQDASAISQNVDESAEILPRRPFTCVKIPGRGFGMVANRDIKKGELILEEKPILTLAPIDVDNNAGEQHVTVAGIMKQYNMLSRSDQNKIKQLHSVSEPKTILGIIQANSFVRGVISEESVLCIESSRFNHSCRQNVSHGYVAEKDVERIVACRDVKEGEELLTCYAPPFDSYSSRQAVLRCHYGFECDCVVCAAPPEERKQNDKLREQFKMLDKRIPEVGSLNPKEGLGLVADALRILEKLDLQLAPLLEHHYYDGFQLAKGCGQMTRAKLFAKKAAEAVAICEGETTKHKKLLSYSKNPSLHINGT
ncbi:hypothetical protein CYMTET_42349 [Cymbomonas tetramitiformis]|uniref:SET domain-containing protein n=1 Tax=Cymbomonas tetramitiformis TaxID=36881 RepID=A0AAE0C499_9CHLO|nr:hypothetical protein CYMTET_42351 [Cymbomonas tetramitiformis]KAK3248178.1 hypothetical protein CYMTET_42349 [Cymbomonas tetramitiformis]